MPIKYQFGCSAIRILLIIVSALACNSHEKSTQIAGSGNATVTSPLAVSLDTCPPVQRVELKNVPPPIIIRVPKKPGKTITLNSDFGMVKVQLKPPVVKPAAVPMAHFTNFKTEEGLPSNTINASARDSKGRIWLSAGNKVCRYEGNSFSTFQVEMGAQVAGIAEDRKGHLWFATFGGGVVRYDGVSFTRYTTKKGLANDLVTNVLVDKQGIIWFSTSGGGIEPV